MKMNVVLFLQLFLFVEGVSGFINSPAPLPTANRALASTANTVVLPKNDLNSLTSAELESMRLEGAAALASTTNAVDLQSELEAAGLGVCTGPLHAIGSARGTANRVRRVSGRDGEDHFSHQHRGILRHD